MDFGTQVNSIINNICEQLGTTVENLVPELARYKTASAIAACVVGVVIFSVAMILMMVMFEIGEHSDDFEWEWRWTGTAIGITGLALAAIVWCVNVYNYIIWSKAPTGATMEWIINQITNK